MGLNIFTGFWAKEWLYARAMYQNPNLFYDVKKRLTLAAEVGP